MRGPWGFLLLPLLILVPSAPLLAHFVTPSEILDVLNSPRVKAVMGIRSAAVDAKVPRLLIVAVSADWYRISETDRVANAASWLTLWRHATTRGVVSVVEPASGRAVLSYDPEGAAHLIAARSEPRD
jgi:hypothetical protein